MPTTRAARPPRWYGVPARVLLVTVIAALLCFSVTLLFAIFGTVILASLHGVHPDMRVAYRHVALPIALAAAAIIFVVTFIIEIRHFRQTKTLSTIERIS
jgi:hypothetical protein